jgi:3-oxoacyl-[acyl-carrier-protein] synthase-1
MPAEILAIGMVTPVGLCAAQTAASVRTGIGRLAESYVNDVHGNMLVMGLADQEHLPPLAEILEDDALSPRHLRLARMGGPALAEVLAVEPTQPIPLLLGVTEPRKEANYPVGQELLRILSAQAGHELDINRSRVYALGRAAGLVALAEALTLINRREVDTVLVGGVDSYLDIALLQALDREGRLKSGVLSDGFVPGEGAAFVLVAAAGTARRQRRQPLALITGVGRGHEPGHIYSHEPHRGEGLNSAFRALFDAVPDPADRVGCVYVSLNGESFWAKEWGVASIRSADRLSDPLRIEHPVDCMGDPGAALGLIMLALATHELSRGSGQSPCLVCAASDGAERVAVLLARA